MLQRDQPSLPMPRKMASRHGRQCRVFGRIKVEWRLLHHDRHTAVLGDAPAPDGSPDECTGAAGGEEPRGHGVHGGRRRRAEQEEEMSGQHGIGVDGERTGRGESQQAQDVLGLVPGVPEKGATPKPSRDDFSEDARDSEASAWKRDGSGVPVRETVSKYPS